ncbi:autophagy protein 13 [Loxospora ochrophaea]|nr:autophagy protein 13 [Loxospora ochrophaea]
MVIELFIDVDELTNRQSLIIADDYGRQWDVEEALASPTNSNEKREMRSSRPQVLIERWRIELSEQPKELAKDLGNALPKIYKNSIVLFRSLVAYAKLLPAWRFGKKLFKPRSSTDLPKLRYRLTELSQRNTSEVDPLTLPLFDGQTRVVERFSFGPIDSPAGSFSIQVTYRTGCDFRIDNSEALLSSKFAGMDEDLFEPSLGNRTRNIGGEKTQTRRAAEIGSLPHRHRGIADQPDQGQAYGSLSTFHQTGPQLGSSPLSALRAARDRNTQSPNSPPQKAPSSVRHSAQGSRSSLRSTDAAPGVGRRPSVSFMPFKAPSVSASPLPADQSAAPSPRNSIGKSSALIALAEARNPAAASQGLAPPHTSPNPSEQAVTSSVSSSPKPAPIARYSSSFGHRRARLSTGGGSKTDEDNNSSGKASLTSSAAQRESGTLAEGGGASSGSIPTDDDNISDFLKMLDQKKSLKSFQAPNDPALANASTQRTTAALSKFQRMRDSNAALSDSMSSSLLLHRSSSSSSRQLSNVPPMVAGTSMSISSSPGKPISPHTPHTPAIPSRLSANSIVEYPHRDRSGGRHRLSQEGVSHTEAPDNDGEIPDTGTGAIDIPTSPRPYLPGYRRSSSVAQQTRNMALEEEIGDALPFGMRSASLGADERQPLSLSALLSLQENSGVTVPAADQNPSFGPTPNPDEGGFSMARQPSSSIEGRDDVGSAPTRGTPHHLRTGRGGSGRGHHSPHGSLTSLAGDRGSGSGSSDQRRGRYSFTRPASNFEEEEPLLFAMSDFGVTQNPQSRRSLEEGRGGSSAGAIERGGADSGASSRRGSRRGGHTWA